MVQNRAILVLALAHDSLWLEGVSGPQTPQLRVPGKV